MLPSIEEIQATANELRKQRSSKLLWFIVVSYASAGLLVYGMLIEDWINAALITLPVVIFITIVFVIPIIIGLLYDKQLTVKEIVLLLSANTNNKDK